MLDLCTSCPFPLFSLPPFTLFLPLLTPSFAKKNAPQPVSVPSGNSQGPWNRPPCREIVFLRGQARSVAFSVNLAPPPPNGSELSTNHIAACIRIPADRESPKKVERLGTDDSPKKGTERAGVYARRYVKSMHPDPLERASAMEWSEPRRPLSQRAPHPWEGGGMGQ